MILSSNVELVIGVELIAIGILLLAFFEKIKIKSWTFVRLPLILTITTGAYLLLMHALVYYVLIVISVLWIIALFKYCSKEYNNTKKEKIEGL